jgi:hypothetical protein
MKPRKTRSCTPQEIGAKAVEQFEAAEKHAAEAYETSEKGVLSGQVFVATRGGENVKLGAVRVELFANDAIDILLAGVKAFADAKSKQMEVDIAAAKEKERKAEAAAKQPTAAEEQAMAAAIQAEAVAQQWTAAEQQGRAAEASVVMSAKAREAANAARAELDSLLEQKAYYYSNQFLFTQLRSPIQTAETDGDRRFTIQIPRRGAYVLAVQAERPVQDEMETYHWMQPVSLNGQQQLVQNLSNRSIREAGAFSSLELVREKARSHQSASTYSR